MSTLVNTSKMQVIFNPEQDDLQSIIDDRPFEVLVATIQVSPKQVVLRFARAMAQAPGPIIGGPR